MNFQNNTNSLLEHRRLLQLANEYLRKGYSVSIYPSSEKLPPKLAGLSLDLIADNGSKVVAAKVRTRETLSLNGSEDLLRISKLVEQLPGWEFELVVTNPRKFAPALLGSRK
jgi:REase_AHJR-like